MRRQVPATRKDTDGDITALCKSFAAWSPRPKADAISDIEDGIHEYYVYWTDGIVTDIHVVNGPYGKYLRTDRDHTTRNNLDDLPGC